MQQVNWKTFHKCFGNVGMVLAQKLIELDYTYMSPPPTHPSTYHTSLTATPTSANIQDTSTSLPYKHLIPWRTYVNSASYLALSFCILFQLPSHSCLYIVCAHKLFVYKIHIMWCTISVMGGGSTTTCRCNIKCICQIPQLVISVSCLAHVC